MSRRRGPWVTAVAAAALTAAVDAAACSPRVQADDAAWCGAERSAVLPPMTADPPAGYSCPAPLAGTPCTANLTQWQATRAVAEHNKFRRRHGACDLRWDPAIAADVAASATLSTTCQSKTPTRGATARYAENIYTEVIPPGYTNSPFAVDGVLPVQTWFCDEEPCVDFAAPAVSTTTQQAAQILWRSVTAVGCAACAHGSFYTVVCGYDVDAVAASGANASAAAANLWPRGTPPAAEGGAACGFTRVCDPVALDATDAPFDAGYALGHVSGAAAIEFRTALPAADKWVGIGVRAGGGGAQMSGLDITSVFADSGQVQDYEPMAAPTGFPMPSPQTRTILTSLATTNGVLTATFARLLDNGVDHTIRDGVPIDIARAQGALNPAAPRMASHQYTAADRSTQAGVAVVVCPELIALLTPLETPPVAPTAPLPPTLPPINTSTATRTGTATPTRPVDGGNNATLTATVTVTATVTAATPTATAAATQTGSEPGGDDADADGTGSGDGGGNGTATGEPRGAAEESDDGMALVIGLAVGGGALLLLACVLLACLVAKGKGKKTKKFGEPGGEEAESMLKGDPATGENENSNDSNSDAEKAGGDTDAGNAPPAEKDGEKESTAGDAAARSAAGSISLSASLLGERQEAGDGGGGGGEADTPVRAKPEVDIMELSSLTTATSPPARLLSGGAALARGGSGSSPPQRRASRGGASDATASQTPLRNGGGARGLTDLLLGHGDADVAASPRSPRALLLAPSSPAKSPLPSQPAKTQHPLRMLKAFQPEVELGYEL